MRIPLLIAALLVLPAKAFAQQTTLFLLGDFQQSITLSYNFAGRNDSYTQGRNNSSTQNRFEETYHVSLPYAILSPRLFKGSLALDLGANEGFYSASGSSSGSDQRLNLQYLIDGTLLDRTSTPARFAYSSTISHITQEFSSGYDLKTDFKTVALSIKNNRLPIAASYSDTNSETSGLRENTTQRNRNFFISTQNKIGDLSETHATISYNSGKTGTVGSENENSSSRSYSGSVSNVLTWGQAGRERRLSTLYDYRSSAGLFNETSNGIGTNLTWALGRALHVGGGYQYSTTEGATETSESNSANAWLEHRLFENLVTRMEVTGRQEDTSTGKEREVIGNLNLSYQKRLPKESALGLNFQQQWDLVDRNFSLSSSTSKETITISNNGNTLSHELVEVGSIIVWSLDHTKQYKLDSGDGDGDYIIRELNNQTTLIFLGSPTLHEGDKVEVSYSHAVNPSITYRNDTRALSASLSLFKSRYNLMAGYRTTTQHLLSGSADSVRLEDERNYTLGANTRWDRTSLSLNYSNTQATTSEQQSVEAAATTDHEFALGTGSFQIRDSYGTSRRTSSTISGGSESIDANLFTASASFKTVLMNMFSTQFLGSYAHSSGGGGSRDYYNLGVNMNTSYRRFTISLRSQLNWQQLPSYTTTSESVRLDISRSF